MSSVLIATLGAEPQVISLATHLLLARPESLHRVVVVHTDPACPPVNQALPLLQQAFAAQNGWPPLVNAPVPATDVLTPAELDAFGDTLYQTLQTYLGQGCRVHLLLAGGRKSMTMVGMSVAHLLLGPDDHVWYLYSDEGLRTAGRMVPAPGDHVQLMPIPLPRPTLAAPQLTPTGRAPTRADALAAVDTQRVQQARDFFNHLLTPAERTLAALVATEVLTVEAMAARLHKSPKTVTNQLTTIYSKLESVFGLQSDVGIKREFLRRELGPYLTANPPKKLGVASHDKPAHPVHTG